MLTVLLNDLTANTSRILKKYNDESLPYVSGLEIAGTSIYNVCPGKVVAVGQESNKTYAVTVFINNNQMIRYTNLEYADVKVGQQLTFRDYIGRCKKFVRLEYCTPNKGHSIWPVRIDDITMYKHDPEGLINGSIKLKVYYGGYEDSSSITDSSLYELSDNRGE